MGLADTFGAEDRMNVKFSDFYNLVKGCTQRDMLINGIKEDVPHEYMRKMMGVKSNVEEKSDNNK